MAFAERTALVTGAASGLGEALATRLAEAGHAVAVHYHTQADNAEAIAERLRRGGAAALAVGGDLSREADAGEVVRQIGDWAGRLDVLINNAGAYHAAGLMELTEEQWFAGLNSTASAVFFTTRAALPLLRRSGCGRVVNLGDSSADRPTARDLAVGYHVGKTGVLMLTRSFARQEAAHGITVNMISPGYLENSMDLDTAEQVPAGRYGRDEDVWVALAHLLDDASGYQTGSNLILSGGWNLR